MDEIDRIEWQPAPLPVDRVKPGRPTSPSKEGQEEIQRRQRQKEEEKEEEEANSHPRDSYQREDEAPAGAPPKPVQRQTDEERENESLPGHVIDITI